MYHIALYLSSQPVPAAKRSMASDLQGAAARTLGLSKSEAESLTITFNSASWENTAVGGKLVADDQRSACQVKVSGPRISNATQKQALSQEFTRNIAAHAGVPQERIQVRFQEQETAVAGDLRQEAGKAAAAR